MKNKGPNSYDETVSIFDLIGKAGGIHGPTIKNNSWKAIANSKIELVEFETLSELSEIDKSQESLELKQDKLLDFMIENLKKTNQEKKRDFHAIKSRNNNHGKILNI